MRAAALALAALAAAGCGSKTGLRVTLSTTTCTIDNIDELLVRVTQLQTNVTSKEVKYDFDARTLTSGQPLSFVLLFDGTYTGDVGISVTYVQNGTHTDVPGSVMATITAGQVTEVAATLTCGCSVDGDCMGGQRCNPNTRACEDIPMPDMSMMPCDATSCANGCCAADGTCQPGTADAQCGTGGQQCQACMNGDNCGATSHTCCPGGGC